MLGLGAAAKISFSRSLLPTVPGSHGSLQPTPLSPSLHLNPLVERGQRTWTGVCSARRRVRYDDDDDGGGGEEHGHNSEIAVLEMYSESTRGKALLVRATVDGEEEEVLIFKGFSSLLSSGTFSDPSRSVLPARAVITSIDVVKGPFNPSNIEYLERNLTWEEFKNRLNKQMKL